MLLESNQNHRTLSFTLVAIVRCALILSKQCYISKVWSDDDTLMFLRRNLLTWWLVETSSILLFRSLPFYVMMWNFSAEQRWQNLGPLLYGRA